MAIPDFQSIFLPLLRELGDGLPHKNADLYHHLADHFVLNDEERIVRQASGNSILFNNRVAFAVFYLNKARAVRSEKRGVWQITERGRELLEQNSPIKINRLMDYPEFRAFRESSPEEIDDNKQIQILLNLKGNEFGFFPQVNEHAFGMKCGILE